MPLPRALCLPLTLACLLALGACSDSTSGNGDADASGNSVDTARGDDTGTASPGCPTEGEELETAVLYIEHNATDADTGVHGLFGGEAWRELCLWDPAGELILHVEPSAQLHEQAVADLFFESREPANDEVAIDTILAAFPEGDYTVGGTDWEGTPRAATAAFTHAIAAEPEILSPELTEEETADEVVVDTTDLVITWAPVTTTITGDPVTIAAYEVIVTKADHDDPDALSRPVYDVHVAPEATSLAVPASFFQSGEAYELEILAIEASGNQTIGLGFFTAA
jgi:hypothetical protein